MSRRWLVLIEFLLGFAFPLALFVFSLAPGLLIEGDSGELIAGVHGFGVIHSPGFPGYVVAAKIFTLVYGFLDVAYAMNLFSAVCGALCCWMVVRIGHNLQLGLWALPAAWTLALSSEFWYASLGAEVYTLSCLALLLITWSSLKVLNEPSLKTWIWLGVAVGFGISVHVYIWAALPLFLWILWPAIKGSSLAPTMARLFLGLSIGLLPYVYIPFRAGKFLWINEGGINSFGRFFDHVTWILQRERVAEDAENFNLSTWIGVKLQQLGYFAGECLHQWSWWTLVVCFFVGLAVLKGTRRQPLRRLCLAAGVFLPAIVWLVFTGREYSLSLLGEMSVHLITLYVYVSLLMLVGLQRLKEVDLPQLSMPLKGLFAAGLVVLMAVTLWVRGPKFNLRDNHIANAHAADLLKDLPENSILVGDSDNDLMPTVFLQAVRSTRPDIKIVNMNNGSRWYYDNLKSLYPDLRWPGYSRGFLIPLIKYNFDSNPVYFSNFFAALTFLKATDIGKERLAVPMHGAYRLTSSGSISLSELSGELDRNFELRPRLYPFQLRGREADVIVQRVDYFLRLAELLSRAGKPDLVHKACARGLAYPTLDMTEFGRAILVELKKICS